MRDFVGILALLVIIFALGGLTVAFPPSALIIYPVASIYVLYLVFSNNKGCSKD